MKTREFIDAIEGMDTVCLQVEKVNRDDDMFMITIGTHYAGQQPFLFVSKSKEYVINTDTPMFARIRSSHQKKIMEIVNEYAATPVEDRKEPTQFYWKVRSESCRDNRNCFNWNDRDENWFLSDEGETSLISTKFSIQAYHNFVDEYEVPDIFDPKEVD